MSGTLDIDLSLEDVDADGAIEETAEAAFSTSRVGFLKLAGVGAAGLVGGLALPEDLAAARATTANDIGFLRFDLVLEYLQSNLYTEAERIGALSPPVLAWARVVGAHERAHRRAIKRLLGRAAVKSPFFNFHGVTEDERRFVKTAVAFEELTAALLKWQAVRLDSRAIVAAAVSLHSVETRHAAWIRHVIGLPPVISAFDKPAPQHEMAKLIASTRFIASRSRTSGRGGPRFTG